MSWKKSEVRTHMHKVMQNVMSKKEITEYRIRIAGTTTEGDGHLGDITFVTIIGKHKNGKAEEFCYVTKSARENEDYRQYMPFPEIFKNEICWYKMVFPIMEKFQKDKHIREPFRNVPKLYEDFTYNNFEVIIMEDLRKTGHIMYDKRKPMNFEHLKVTFSAYGKLHGVSFAMRQQQPELFEVISTNLKDVLQKVMVEINLMEGLLEVIHDINNIFVEDSEIIENFKLLEEKALEAMGLFDATDPYNVIVHGDNWNNNFMFEYKESKETPTDVTFIDWQLTKLGSPIFDLSYHLFSCGSEAELNRADELLKIYHKSLSSFLEEAGCNPEELFPFKELLNQWQKFSLYGFLMSIFELKFILCSDEDLPDFDNVAQYGSFNKMICFEVSDKSLYKNRVLDIINYCSSKYIT